MEKKKYLIINRDKCIGCGSCVAATDGKCHFLDGRAWCSKELIDNPDDIVNICPVDAISSTENEQDYDQKENEYEIQRLEEENKL